MSEATARSTQARNPYYDTIPYGWYGLRWADELAPGEVLPLQQFARELVLWRDADGAPHLMDAYCAHLGAHLGHGGRVDGCALVCPFHGWHWDAQGHNILAPYASKPHPRARMRTYPTIERNGLVMAWFHPNGAPPCFEIPELPECTGDDYAPAHKAEWTIRTTWQETAENGPDFVHLKYVHGAPVVPALESYTTEGPIASMRSTVTFSSPRGDTVGRIDTDSYGPGFSVARFSGIVDLCMIDWCAPVDFEHIVNHKGYRVSRSATSAKVGPAFIKELEHQMDEDIVLFENKIWRDKPALLPEDGPIPQFRRWAAQFYVAPDAEESR